MKFIYLTCFLIFLSIFAIGQDSSSVMSLAEGSFSFDVFPVFKNCTGSSLERTKCTQEKMATFIKEHLEYPSIAKIEKIEGSILVSFVIDKKGEMKDLAALNDIGGGCSEEAKRLIEEMAWNDLEWQPATRKGKLMTTQIYYPIFFDLTKVERPMPDFQMEFVKKTEEMNFSSNDSKIYTLVDKSPLFPFYECETITERGNTNVSPANSCANDALKNFLEISVKYPEAAFQQNIEGEVIVSFIVEKDGSITSPRLLKNLKGGCGAAVLAFVREMQETMRWIAGEKDGKIVRTKYFITYKFDLKTEQKRRE